MQCACSKWGTNKKRPLAQLRPKDAIVHALFYFLKPVGNAVVPLFSSEGHPLGNPLPGVLYMPHAGLSMRISGCGSVWSIWSVRSVSRVWSNKTNRTDGIDQTDQIDRIDQLPIPRLSSSAYARFLSIYGSFTAPFALPGSCPSLHVSRFTLHASRFPLHASSEQHPAGPALFCRHCLQYDRPAGESLF